MPYSNRVLCLVHILSHENPKYLTVRRVKIGSFGSTVVEHSTQNPKVRGSNRGEWKLHTKELVELGIA